MTDFSRAYTGSKLPPGYPSLPEGWHSEATTFLSADDDLKLFAVLHRRSSGPIRRLLLIVHGHGEHGGRYGHFPHFLHDRFDAILCPDLRGHGRSEGQRGHAEDFDQLVEDARKISEEIRLRIEAEETEGGAAESPLEIQIFGHSLGGHIVLRLAHLHRSLEVSRFHVSAPFLALKAETSALKRGGAHVLKHLWGNLALSTGLDATSLSHDPEVVRNYLADRLNHDRMTPDFYVSMTRAIKDTQKHFIECAYPIQFLLPMADPLIDSAVSKKFAERLKSIEKRIVEFEGFYHEPMNEIGKEKFFEAILAFVGE